MCSTRIIDAWRLELEQSQAVAEGSIGAIPVFVARAAAFARNRG
jgi:hypothetical protein